MGKTLFDKVWDNHVISKIENGPDVLFIDRHFIHEVTSPVAFVGLKSRNLKVLFPDKTFATADHNTPTINQHLPIKDVLSAQQVKTLEKSLMILSLNKKKMPRRFFCPPPEGRATSCGSLTNVAELHTGHP